MYVYTDDDCRYFIGWLPFSSRRQAFPEDSDRVKLAFDLDDANRTKITREAIVRNFDERSIRCKFVVTATGLDPDLGFYLRSQ